MASVEERVKQIIVEQLGVDEGEVTPTASFVDDLGADSLDTVELVMAFDQPRHTGATGPAPSRVGRKDMLSTPVVAGRGRGKSSKRRRRRTRTNLLPHQGPVRTAGWRTPSPGQVGRGIDHKSGGVA